MPNLKPRDLDSGYAWEVDRIDDSAWCDALQQFSDANIYQTWSYGSVVSGKTSHLVLRKDGETVAIAQVRIAHIPFVRAGVAYVQWGPLWRRKERDECGETFRQALRALRNEFACKQGLTVRVFPLLFETDADCLGEILKDEGFRSVGAFAPSRTIIMDLNRSIEDIRRGMRPHWQRELKAAERGGLEVTTGTGDELFERFSAIYREMVLRKKFPEPNDIEQFRQIQAKLPELLKMKVMLCSMAGTVCAGVIYSTVGKMAVYLFGATSNAGLKSRGSYLLQWKLIEDLKRNGMWLYDLNGINPVENPGTYKFKSDLGGDNARDVYFLGRFDANGSVASWFCVECWAALRRGRESLRRAIRAVCRVRPRLTGTSDGSRVDGVAGELRGSTRQARA